MSVLIVDTVSKSFGVHEVLKGVSFSIDPGERVALIGHNGAGKTTLIRAILGLTTIEAGQIEIEGNRPGSAGARRIAAYLPETAAFHRLLTGREQLRALARVKGEPVSAADTLLARVGLARDGNRRIGTYSKGMRQRLGLAQALLGTPKLLFLDEPTNGLDPPLRRQFYDVVGRITAAGATAIISSHVLTEIEARADLIAILRHGRLVAFGSLDDLRLQSGLPFRLRMAVRSDAVGRVAETLGHEYALIRRDDDTVEFACATADKMRIIKQVATFNGMVRDVDVLPPRLDDVYEYFVPDEDLCGEAVR